MTQLRKGRDGWQAEDTIMLDDVHALKITTSKRSSGGLSTIATRVKMGSISDGFSGFSFIMFSDFSKMIMQDRAARCTEKTITTMHAAAMATLDTIKADCAEFYAAKEGRMAA